MGILFTFPMGISSSRSLSEGRPIAMKCRGQEVLPPDHFEIVRFEPRHFDEGTFRFAFKGTIIVKAAARGRVGGDDHGDKDKVCWIGRLFSTCTGWAKDLQGHYPCVVKKFKTVDAMFSSYWVRDVGLLLEAQKLADEFNSLFEDMDDQIHFATPFLAEVIKIGYTTNVYRPLESPPGTFHPDKCEILPGECRDKERVCIEPYLDGEFQKLNSNTGWVWRSPLSEAAQAFSHWTWSHTRGKLLLCDLQGTRRGTAWLLTDPAAHSSTPGFLGPSDLGPRGMDAFFREHTCNDLCRDLPKKAPEQDPPLPLSPQRRTSFLLDLLTAATPVAVRASTAVHQQTGGTCYAHAVGTVMRAAESRVVGRKLQEHETMVMQIIEEFGTHGADSRKVLEKECPKRRLHFRTVNRNVAVCALRAGRAVLLAFWLSDRQWAQFSAFFKTKPGGVLSSSVFTSDASPKKGHAVAVVGQEHGIWTVKNSWGGGFATAGRFKMKWDALPEADTKFLDVFWYEHDLTMAEKQAFQNSSIKIPDDPREGRREGGRGGGLPELTKPGGLRMHERRARNLPHCAGVEVEQHFQDSGAW